MERERECLAAAAALPGPLWASWGGSEREQLRPVICSSSERGRELRSRFASAARERLRASSYAPVFFPALKFSP